MVHVPAAERPFRLAALDAASLALFAALGVVAAARLGGPAPAAWAPLLLVCALLGWAAADLATGAVHWFADTFLAEDTPLLGRALIQPFREHHRDPEAMTRHGFAELCGTSALALAPVMAAAATAADAYGRSLPVSAALAFAAGLLPAAFVTNLVHRWAHLSAAQRPRAVRALQRLRLVLPPEEHARHHDGAHDCAYGVTNGWTNGLVDRIGLYRRLEVWLRGPGRPPRGAASGAGSR